MRILEWLGGQPAWGVLTIAYVLACLLGVLDYLTGPELGFSVFYLLPVAVAAWFVGRRAGVAVSVASSVLLTLDDVATLVPYSHPVYLYWNAVTRLAVFVVATLALSALRRATDNEARLARTDALTGAPNARAFGEMAERERERARRYAQPFTLAILDIDDFKTVNDRFGHAGGDALLRSVADTVRGTLRSVDVVARLGGDEFAILLPGTGHDPGAVVLRKVHKALLDVAARNGWPVTFSIGAVTCTSPARTVGELVSVADGHMYAVKHAGKNGIRQVVL